MSERVFHQRVFRAGPQAGQADLDRDCLKSVSWELGCGCVLNFKNPVVGRWASAWSFEKKEPRSSEERNRAALLSLVSWLSLN